MSRQKGKGMKRRSNWHQSEGESRKFRRATRNFPKTEHVVDKVVDPKPIPLRSKKRR